MNSEQTLNVSHGCGCIVVDKPAEKPPTCVNTVVPGLTMTVGFVCQQRSAEHCMGTTTRGLLDEAPPPFIHPFHITASPALVGVLEPSWFASNNLLHKMKK